MSAAGGCRPHYSCPPRILGTPLLSSSEEKPRQRAGSSAAQRPSAQAPGHPGQVCGVPLPCRPPPAPGSRSSHSSSSLPEPSPPDLLLLGLCSHPPTPRVQAKPSTLSPSPGVPHLPHLPLPPNLTHPGPSPPQPLPHGTARALCELRPGSMPCSDHQLNSEPTKAGPEPAGPASSPQPRPQAGPAHLRP